MRNRPFAKSGKFAKEEFGKHIFENMDPVAMYATHQPRAV